MGTTEETGPAVEDVTCEACGHSTQIMAHPVDGHEQRWQCDCRVSFFIDPREPGVKQPTKETGLCDCAAQNVIPGEPGEPGEAVLNPSASAVGHDDLVEAAGRRLSEAELEALLAAKRGVIHEILVGGGAEPSGEAGAEVVA